MPRKSRAPVGSAATLVACLGLWLSLHACAQAAAPRYAQPRPVDEARVQAAGIHTLSGEHLTLFTDLPADDELARLPAAFDAALPQWLAYFGVEGPTMAGWRMHGFLMVDRDRFRRAGLLPADLPEFRHGYTAGADFWLMEQPSEYYRRHLLLHEGTHGFMFAALGSCGPPWYMEGMAELFGTHRWEKGQLMLRSFPANRDEVPMLGRIKIIRDAVAADRVLTLPEIFHYDSRAHLQNEPYAWCWAAAKFLDAHPRYQARFRALARDVGNAAFAEQLHEAFRADLAGSLATEWSVFVRTLDYGYDIPRNAIEFAPGAPLANDGAQVEVQADHGWQSSRIELEPGKTYRLRASGRYQVAQEPRPWDCEPGGVTIRYVAG
ncbi:MAG: hypothetical protein KDA42_19565, partial [Planctomycetales bacterium]|nr:hypothetical protein [Planctomycetales bacterium]